LELHKISEKLKIIVAEIFTTYSKIKLEALSFPEGNHEKPQKNMPNFINVFREA
jgi:hypothetical protein